VTVSRNSIAYVFDVVTFSLNLLEIVKPLLLTSAISNTPFSGSVRRSLVHVPSYSNPTEWPLPLMFRLRLSLSSLPSKARLFSSAITFQPVALLLSAPHGAFRGCTAETPTTLNASSLTVLPSRQAGSYHVTARDDSVR